MLFIIWLNERSKRRPELTKLANAVLLEISFIEVFIVWFIKLKSLGKGVLRIFLEAALVGFLLLSLVLTFIFANSYLGISRSMLMQMKSGLSRIFLPFLDSVLLKISFSVQVITTLAYFLNAD